MHHPTRHTRHRGRARARTALALVATGVLASTLFGTAASAAVVAAPSGVDRVVSLSGSIDSSCGSGIPSGRPVYTSIQAAVNAALLGEQIYVCAGTYTQNVTVNKDGIDLLGPNWNDPAQGSDPAIITAASAGSPVVQFTGLTNTDSGLRGFELVGGTHGVLVAASDGSGWDDASTEGIRNNTITGSTTAGIQTNGLNGPATVSGNIVAPAAGADGIVVLNAGSGYTVSANEVTLTGTSGTGIRVGLESITGAGLVSTGVTVSANTVSGGGNGVHVYGRPNEGTLQQFASNITVTGNTIGDPSGSGVLVSGGADSIEITGNTIADTGGSGIWLKGPSVTGGNDISTTTILSNTITGAGRDGVEITGYVTGTSIGQGTASGNTIADPGRHGISAIGTLIGTTTTIGVRTFTVSNVTTTGNTISGAGCDGVHVENVDFATVYSTTITDSGCDGVSATDVDWIDTMLSTITGSADDGVHYSNTYTGWVHDSTIKSNAGDGIELADGTGSIGVNGNDVNLNGAGIRVTSPTVPVINTIIFNDVSSNLSYGCQDLSSGLVTNPPATGTQGNTWGTSNTGASLQDPNGICGATLAVTGSLPDGTVGSPYSASAPSVTGAPGGYTWTSTPLPDGLTLDPATGEITGTPTTPVTNLSVTFWVVSASGVAGQYTDTITIFPALTAAGSLEDGTVGTPYTSSTPSVSGGSGPYTWSATGLPEGLTIDPATGVVSGTPTLAVGEVTVTRTVTDATGATATITETIAILPDGTGIPIVHPAVAGIAAGLGLVVVGLRARRRGVVA